MKKISLLVLVLCVCCFALVGCGDKNKTGAVTGTIVNVSDTTLEIATSEGTNYEFDLKDAEIAKDVVFENGYNVSVYYKGELDDDNLIQKVKVSKVQLNDAAATSVVPTETPGDDADDANDATEDKNEKYDNDKAIGTVTGTVTEATMEIVTIKTADGTIYSFDQEEAKIQGGSSGILIGDSVTITYTDTLIADKVMDASEVTKN